MVLIILLVFIFLFSLLLWLFPIVQVCGDSMYPTLRDGEYLIGRRIIRKNKKTIKINELYIYTPPTKAIGERYVIKRLHDRLGNDLIFLGDNQCCSYDSKHYGAVSSKRVVAKVMYRKQVKV